MRVVLDTNIVASALLWGDAPGRLIDAAGEGTLEFVTFEALLAELAGILERAKFAAKLRQKNLSAAEIVARYREMVETVEAPSIEEAALRDPDDAVVLACALAARAEAIVLGDDDLHAIGSYQGIPILSAAECLQRLGLVQKRDPRASRFCPESACTSSCQSFPRVRYFDRLETPY